MPLHPCEKRPTGVGVSGAHPDHRGADTRCLSQAQAVVLLLGEDRRLIVGIFNIYDHLQGKKKQYDPSKALKIG